jgi:hypothetical protein
MPIGNTATRNNRDNAHRRDRRVLAGHIERVGFVVSH